MTSRQEQRQQIRARIKAGEAATKAGVPIVPLRSDIIGVATVLMRQLNDIGVADRASRAAAAAHALTQASTRRTPGAAKLACAKGCGWCCHTWVGALAPEVFLLARALRKDAVRQPGEIGRIIEASGRTAGKNPAERLGTRLPCALLVDNACSRYDERPNVCRQVTSLDLGGCIEEYEGRNTGGEIKISSVYLAHARNARLPLLAAMRAAGLPVTIYELSAALSVALMQADAEQRWLMGIDVFAGVATGPNDPPEVRRAVDELLKELVA